MQDVPDNPFAESPFQRAAEILNRPRHLGRSQ
jgi:hypothetical protein